MSSIERRRQQGSLFGTCLEIQPYNTISAVQKRRQEIHLESEDNGDLSESNLRLGHKYLWAIHLGSLPEMGTNESIDIMRRRARNMMPYDHWARIPWSRYSTIGTPKRFYTDNLYLEFYSEPKPGKLPPIVFRWLLIDTPITSMHFILRFFFHQLSSYSYNKLKDGFILWYLESDEIFNFAFFLQKLACIFNTLEHNFCMLQVK